MQPQRRLSSTLFATVGACILGLAVGFAQATTWVPLFNGKDLGGWHLRDPKGANGWTVRDGVSVNTLPSTDIQTDREFYNFDLHVEFNVAPESNAGIYMRDKYEVQILDSAGKPPDAAGNGALYRRVAPRINASKPAGEWQTYDINFVGRRLTLVHNGQKVLDNVDVGPMGTGAASNRPDGPGPLRLQGDHGNVSFRNVRIRPLPGNPPPVTDGTTALRLGIIGLDTSHVLRFAELLNDPARPDHVPGARVVAGFKGGSPDFEPSATRIDRFTSDMKNTYGIEIVDSIDALVKGVDAVLLTSVDGRKHLEQVRTVFAAKKRVFIDKPFTASVRDAREIIRLARESGTPFFSSSPRRFSEEIEGLKKNVTTGDVLGALTFGPSPIAAHHPDLFWYGIHSVESLYTLMGPGVETVARTYTEGADVTVGRWKDGRTGIVRGTRAGNESYGAVVFGSQAVAGTSSLAPAASSGSDRKEPARSGYHGIVSAVIEFFRTGVAPVSPEETLEIMAFMEAADVSKARGGAAVRLDEVIGSVGTKTQGRER